MNKNEPATDTNENAADFETAITACGIGAFNIYLLCVAITDVTSAVFTTSTISYIIPTAECDLKLALMTKGVLNAMPFLGMILSAFPWGFVADTKGRRNILIYALFLDGVVVFLSGLSQNFQQLLAFKFFDGFLVSGPYAVIMSYISEFYCARHRPRIMMLTGLIKALSAFILPVLAYFMLPIHMLMKNEHMRVHTWQFFIMFTSIVPLCGGFIHFFFPESPKFLMAQGRNEEALKCLQTIYSVNSGKPKDTYPITTLIEEDPEKSERYRKRNSNEYREYVRSLDGSTKRKLARNNFMDSIRQLQPLCANPYFGISLQVYALFFFTILALNSIRLWMPQIFATMVEFEHKHGSVSSSMCSILSYKRNKTKLWHSERHKDVNCDVHITSDSYVNNIIVASIIFCGYILSSVSVNKLGNSNIMKIALFLSFLSGSALYFSSSSNMTLVLSSIFLTSCSISTTTILSASVSLFPTSVRTMVVVIAMTFGRCGSLLGNILFPYFISLGCIHPFALIGSVMLMAFILSLFLPTASKVPFN